MSESGVFPGPNFSLFGLKREIWKVNRRIQSEKGRILTKKKIRIWTLSMQCCCYCFKFLRVFFNFEIGENGKGGPSLLT